MAGAFRQAGPRQERDFLRAVVAANPREAVARLELLDLEGRIDGPEVSPRWRRC